MDVFRLNYFFWSKQAGPDVWFQRYKAPRVFEGEHYQRTAMVKFNPVSLTFSIILIGSRIARRAFIYLLPMPMLNPRFSAAQGTTSTWEWCKCNKLDKGEIGDDPPRLTLPAPLCPKRVFQSSIRVHTIE